MFHLREKQICLRLTEVSQGRDALLVTPLLPTLKISKGAYFEFRLLGAELHCLTVVV